MPKKGDEKGTQKKELVENARTSLAKIKQYIDQVKESGDTEMASKLVTDLHTKTVSIMASAKNRKFYIGEAEIIPQNRYNWKALKCKKVKGTQQRKEVSTRTIASDLVSVEDSTNAICPDLLKALVQLLDYNVVESAFSELVDVVVDEVSVDSLNYSSNLEEGMHQNLNVSKNAIACTRSFESCNSVVSATAFLVLLSQLEEQVTSKKVTLVPNGNELISNVFYSNDSLLKKIPASLLPTVPAILQESGILRFGERALLFAAVFGAGILRIFGKVPHLQEQYLSRCSLKRLVQTILTLSSNQIEKIQKNVETFNSEEVILLQQKLDKSFKLCKFTVQMQKIISENASKLDYNCNN